VQVEFIRTAGQLAQAIPRQQAAAAAGGLTAAGRGTAIPAAGVAPAPTAGGAAGHVTQPQQQQLQQQCEVTHDVHDGQLVDDGLGEYAVDEYGAVYDGHQLCDPAYEYEPDY
jgi:hypothetical protein